MWENLKWISAIVMALVGVGTFIEILHKGIENWKESIFIPSVIFLIALGIYIVSSI